MGKKQVILYKLDRVCKCCKSDEFLGIKPNQTMMLTILVSNLQVCFVKDRLISVQVDKTEICSKCWYIMIGLEDYFDQFVEDIIRNNLEEARQILNYLYDNPKMLEEAVKMRDKGNFFTNELISKVTKKLNINGGKK